MFIFDQLRTCRCDDLSLVHHILEASCHGNNSSSLRLLVSFWQLMALLPTYTFFFYKQQVYKHASLGFPEKLSTSLSTPSGSDWLEATKDF